MTQASRSKNKFQVYFHLYRAAGRTARSFAFVGCLVLSIVAAQGQASGQIPVITSAASANTTVGTAFSYQITASGSPTRYGATSLPGGLTLNATTGRISGVLAVIDGAYNATVSATNAGGTGVRVLGISVAPARPVITSAATAAGRQGIALSYKIAATNFPRTFSATGLPSGLTLNATSGVISGTPSAAGNTTATLTATNGAGGGTKSLVFAVFPQAPVISSAASASTTVGAAFSYQITASDSPTRYGATSLPSGLTLNATTGRISGVLAVIDGAYNATVSATNAGGTGVRVLGISVAPARPVITSAATAAGRQGIALSYKIAATNFPRTFSATGLPSGLTLNATSGVISGTPSAAGNTTATLTATNGAGGGTKSLVFAVFPQAPVISSAASASTTVGAAFSYQITASDSPTRYGATSLPSGLTLNATTGRISGAPTVIDGAYNATISATNAGGTGSKALRISLAPARPVITSAVTAAARQGTAFTYKIGATNFPRTFSATGLPSGLTVNATSGVISGTPATVGNATVTLTASNGAGGGTKSLVIAVIPQAPVITSAASANAAVGTAFSYQITASGSPTRYGATSLTSGLTLNATTGVISGVPTIVGNATMTISASNVGGSGTKAFFLQVAKAILINASEIPSGVRNQLYAGHTFTATGGSGGNTWSVIDGFLPTGMTLNASTGTLGGTPTNVGTFAFTLRVRETRGFTDEVDVILEVEDPSTEFTVGSVLSAIPGGGATQSDGNTTCSFDYNPSGSTWIEGVSEEDVFFASMNSSSGWRLGVGKGGQVYSLRGPFGEAIPPQRVDAPWVDEAWQFVATSLDLVSPVHEFQSAGSAQRLLGFPIQFFIHQSGIYRGGLAGNSLVGSPTMPFYSPVLKKHWNPATRTLSLVNWSQMARSPNVWKSGMLTYASYRDLGNGAIEVTNFVTNFGDQDLTFINTPWGGARPSTFPETILSRPTGAWSIASQGSYGSNTPIHVKDTGGWQAWVQNSTQEQSDSMAVVFGNRPLPTVSDQEWKGFHTILTYGLTHVGRDYAVSSIQNNIRLQAGQSLACRWHLVVGPFGQTRIKAADLASHAGLWMPQVDASVVTPVWTTAGIPSSTGEGAADFYLYAQPIPGTVPVFAMEDTRTGRIFATLDPYELCPTAPYPNPLPSSHHQYALYQNRVVHYQYSSPGAVRDLLGYAYPEARATGDNVEVSLPGVVGGVPLKVWAPAR